VQRRPFWLTALEDAEVRKQAEIMELETRQFYQKADGQVTDAGVRKLLGDLGKSSASTRYGELWKRDHANVEKKGTRHNGACLYADRAAGLAD